MPPSIQHRRKKAHGVRRVRFLRAVSRGRNTFVATRLCCRSRSGGRRRCSAADHAYPPSCSRPNSSRAQNDAGRQGVGRPRSACQTICHCRMHRSRWACAESCGLRGTGQSPPLAGATPRGCKHANPPRRVARAQRPRKAYSIHLGSTRARHRQYAKDTRFHWRERLEERC